MIIDLRFIERDGKRILQFVDNDSIQIEDGTLGYVWQDVPLVTEQDG